MKSIKLEPELNLVNVQSDANQPDISKKSRRIPD